MTEQINLFASHWFDWMFSMSWQVSLLIIIIGGIDLLIKNWVWPQVRYALWLLILVKLVIPPGWTFSGSVVPNLRVVANTQLNTEDIQSEFLESSVPDPGISSNDQNVGENKKESFINPAQKNESEIRTYSSISWKSYLMGGWLLGIGIFAFVLSKRISKFKKWHIEQEEKKNIPPWFHDIFVRVGKTLAIERLPSIVFSNEALTPAVYGLFKPVLLLPEKYIDELTEEEAEHVLLHELAHVKRGDLIVHGICLILQIIYWFNPFLIWARKQMKNIREICCDMTIANILREKTKKYKDTLVNTARKLLTETMEPGMGLLGLFEEPFQLISRLKWLNKESWKSRRAAGVTAMLVSFLFVAFVLPMGELNKFVPPGEISFLEPEPNDSDEYRNVIASLNAELNTAFMNWDFGTIERFYTNDAIIDQESLPPVEGISNIMNDFKQQKQDGLKFNSLDNFILELWKDGNNINVLESYNYSINLEELKLSGRGSSFTIWEIQENDSIKIKYSIFNLDSILPATN